MTTTVHTVTTSKQTLIRDLTDLDPKVRNQIPLIVIVLAATIYGVLTGHITWLAAGGIDAPFLINFAVAYITTSSHKQLILDGIKQAEDVLKEAAPAIAAAAPKAGPIIEDAESLAAAVSGGVIASTTSVPTQAAITPAV